MILISLPTSFGNIKLLISVRVPQKILSCRTISREINFTSNEKIEKFRLEQRVYLKGTVIEGLYFFEWNYKLSITIQSR